MSLLFLGEVMAKCEYADVPCGPDDVHFAALRLMNVKFGRGLES